MVSVVECGTRNHRQNDPELSSSTKSQGPSPRIPPPDPSPPPALPPLPLVLHW